MGDRIKELETLVRTLLQQQPQQGQTPQTPAFSLEPGSSPQSTSGGLEGLTPLASADDNISVRQPPPLLRGRERALSVASSDHGSIHLTSHNATYVNSVHWAAVLDSISELKDHYEKEEEARTLALSDHVPRDSPGPRLLYEPVQATKADILASIPPRPVVDRMVARYFNAQNSASLPVLHCGHFLQEVRIASFLPFPCWEELLIVATVREILAGPLVGLDPLGWLVVQRHGSDDAFPESGRGPRRP